MIDHLDHQHKIFHFSDKDEMPKEAVLFRQIEHNVSSHNDVFSISCSTMHFMFSMSASILSHNGEEYSGTSPFSTKSLFISTVRSSFL